MGILGSRYLRVKTPQTTDGQTLKIENERVVYKITELPMSAKKHLEIENTTLPNHLKHILEEVDENKAPKIPENKLVIPDSEDMEAEDDLSEIADDPEISTAPVKRKKR